MGGWAALCAATAVAIALVAVTAPTAAAQSLDRLAYVGCFKLSDLQGSSFSSSTQLAPGTQQKCGPYCYYMGQPLAALSTDLRCYCFGIIPDASAALSKDVCEQKQVAGAAAVFYVHKNAASQSCRLAPLPFTSNNFNIHYNSWRVGFGPDGSNMTLRQDWTDGTRLVAADGKYLHGLYQVDGIIDATPGVVTAYYLRDSDDYNTANSGVFDEIDFEFLNGNPGVPHGIWTNSFRKGVSQGERLFKPEQYTSLAKLGANQTAANTWITYGIHWQPDGVSWVVNGALLLRRRYGENVTWADMKKKAFSRTYYPPAEPQHVTFSMWSDQDQKRAFGGRLERGGPFYSNFRALRRILCDLPANSVAPPTWATAAPPSPAPGTSNNANRSPAPSNTNNTNSSPAATTGKNSSKNSNSSPAHVGGKSGNSSPAGRNGRKPQMADALARRMGPAQ